MIVLNIGKTKAPHAWGFLFVKKMMGRFNYEKVYCNE